MLAKIALYIIRVYQSYVRVFLPPCCRFAPNCSEYTSLAIRKYGFVKGVVKGMRRVISCHPLSGKAGYDPLL